jgi:desampylase
MKVGISRAVLDQILTHAAGQPEKEVCGLLLGEAGLISAARPAANVASDSGRMFELDPAVLLAAHKAARGGGPAIVGHYHSHPNGNPSPSPADAGQAESGLLWLIVAGERAALYEARQDGPIHGCFQPVELELR